MMLELHLCNISRRFLAIYCGCATHQPRRSISHEILIQRNNRFLGFPAPAEGLARSLRACKTAANSFSRETDFHSADWSLGNLYLTP